MCEDYTCSNCKRHVLYGEKRRGMCKACYSYYLKHKGMMRPHDTKVGGKRTVDYQGVTCLNCGVVKPLKLGMCENCYHYARRHNGAMRPLDPAIRKSRTRHLRCTNCGRERSHSKGGRRGMCSACYAYWRSHSEMRPKNGARKYRQVPPPICSNCKRNEVEHGKLCPACYEYRLNTGKNRPLRLYTETCLNCDVPLGDRKPRSGLCKPCRVYQRKFGQPRPESVWNAPLGWCECSTGHHPVAATHTVKIRVQSKVEDMHLCDDCYKEHQRQVAWYGARDVKVNNSARHSTR